MRTAIYVHESSTVTIRATDPRDAKAELVRYNRPANVPAIGTHELEPGIYLIVSNGALEITGLRIEFEATRNDKDIWPDPKLNVIALEAGATSKSIQQFCNVAKDISPSG
jgi:hypothetical protein